MGKIQVTLTDEQESAILELKHLGNSKAEIVKTIVAMYIDSKPI